MKSMLLSAAAAFVLMVVSADAVRAQGTIAPSSQLGIGVNTGGFQLAYAISPAIHIGTNLGITATDGSTGIGISPYFRWLFEGTVNPLVQVEFNIGINSTSVGDSSVSNTETGLGLLFGLEYFINRNVGVYAAANLLNLDFVEPEMVTTFGYFAPRVGVEWFFNP